MVFLCMFYKYKKQHPAEMLLFCIIGCLIPSF